MTLQKELIWEKTKGHVNTTTSASLQIVYKAKKSIDFSLCLNVYKQWPSTLSNNQEKIRYVATQLPMVKDAIEAFRLLGDVEKQRLQYKREIWSFLLMLFRGMFNQPLSYTMDLILQ